MTFRQLALPAFLVANVPVIDWYIRRTTDGSDEPLGLLALAAALCFIWRERRDLALRPWVLFAGACTLVLAQLALLHRAPLMLGALSVFFIACGVHNRRSASGIVLLLLLSLPLLAALDFYAGYPLRLVTAEISTRTLQFIGLDVIRSGVMLEHHNALVGVDPPCAGVRMLWTGLFVAAFFSARQRATLWHTVSLAAVALIGVVLANAFRATILFFPESGHVSWPHWTHNAVGLASHACLLVMLLQCDGWLARKFPRTRQSTEMPHDRPALGHSLLRHQFIGGVAAVIALIAGFSIAHVSGAFSTPSSQRSERVSGPYTSTFTDWPATFDGVPLRRLPLSAREEQFAYSFPGAIARFQCGDAEIIMRHVTQATRRLHSSADCLRAMGWQISHQPVFRDADDRTWGSFLALRSGTRYLVTERITPSAFTNGDAFTDVSAWYWNALWEPDSGPWMAVTVMRVADAPTSPH
ncbi:exosortase/archaeosortase family protein [Roseimicrobium sp. ORNL1]|uniref:exosortase/archaeosortase family protein n=1 Tax=Roseimicrobium sp. ORNL1 TaxID=2711231 RepID=UPI0013E10BF5|nr:exosortase/archaeosortase family protein [Roseimicrobium sp. ORNL1]QIF02998.1 exosortase/archaeosortase family protein [Roseimicrobium sp. ORNL1]